MQDNIKTNQSSFSCTQFNYHYSTLAIQFTLSYLFAQLNGTIYQPLRSGRIWHVVNF